MTFAFPHFLFLAPLAGLPVIFHFMMKRREKRMEFPSLMFFLQVDPKMHSKRRLRELLLLAARILLILLLIFTLAKPSLENVPGVEGDLAIAIVVDNSASMDADAGEAGRKLELAQRAARDLVDAMEQGSRAVIVPLVPDPAIDVPLESTGDKERLKDFIDRIRRTEARATVGDAFSNLRRFFDNVPDTMGRAVHVFTDLQKEGWELPPLAEGVLGRRTDFVFHKIKTPPRTRANVAVEAINPPERLLLPGHQYDIEVLVRNNSDFPAEVRMNYEDSLGESHSRGLSLEGRSSKLQQFEFTPDGPGNHWIILWVEGDSFRGDNRVGIGLICKPEALVRFAGRQQEYGLLPRGISPTGTGRFTSLRPVYAEPQRLMDDTDGGPPAMIVCTWEHLAALPENQSHKLRQYVHDGGRLFVVPAVGTRNIPPRPPEWLGAAPVRYEESEEPGVAQVLDRKSGVWRGLRREDGNVAAQFFLVERYAELDLGADYDILLGFSRRRAVLGKRRMGRGRLYVSGIAFDRSWTALATDPSGIMVVMLHNIATEGTSIMDGPMHIGVEAGEHIPIDASARDPIRITSLIGDTVNVTLQPGIRPVLPRAGAYLLYTEDRTYSVSVRGSGQESAEEYLGGDQLAFMGDNPHHVAALTPERDFARQLRRHFVGYSLFLPLAFLVLLFWVLEAWLATMHKKRSRVITHRGMGMNTAPESTVHRSVA